jgi:REP element-mobilizing transposase RayT
MEDLKPIAYALRFNTINNLDVFVMKSFKDLVIDTLVSLKKHFSVTISGYVVMSDHISLVVVPEDSKDFSLFCERLKRNISQKVMEILESNRFSEKRWLLFLVNFINKDNSESDGNRIWCPDNPVKGLYSDAEIEEELRMYYLRPVEEGIVSKPEDYCFSSYRENLAEQLVLDRQAG